MRIIQFIIISAALMIAAHVVSAQEETATELEKQLNNLRIDYETKLSELESRINEIEKDSAEEESESELQELLNKARGLSVKKESTSINRVFRGTERHQPQLNPEISLTGDFFVSYTSSDEPFITETGDFTDGRNQFYMRDVGFHFVSPLDPFTRGKFFLGLPGSGNLSIDEAYMEWLNLPWGLNLKTGQFFNQFGILNRYHGHGLPQFDRPRALTNLFGTGNLSGFGVSGNFLLPKLWADVNELDIEITTSGDGICFDDSFDNVITTAHLKNYYDLTRNTYLELGLSGAHGYNDKDNELKTSLAALDLTCKWVPAGRSHYRTTEFRSEFFFSHREGAKDNLDRFGFYSYINNKMGPRVWTGLRYSYSEMPRDIEDNHEWDISPTIDYWQSEFVFIRFQYSYTNRSYAENDHSLFIHTVWSMGPHKHEAY